MRRISFGRIDWLSSLPVAPCRARERRAKLSRSKLAFLENEASRRKSEGCKSNLFLENIESERVFIAVRQRKISRKRERDTHTIKTDS